jgi:SAM-dependent methyltransferase
MLKMYHQHENSGSSAAYWESAWGILDANAYASQARKHCEASPLWKLVTSKIQPDRLFIDGGCGHGYWVKCLHDLGQKAAGVDFADNTLRQIRRIDPTLDVRSGDVRALPFADGEVHVYYSGGVVEHFEEGPTAALREARRVIASDGWFLCSVPDVSPLRDRLLYREASETHAVRNGPLLVRRASGTAIEPRDQSAPFFQYAFEQWRFRDLLAEAGFDVVDTFGESYVWGLLEVDAVRRLHDVATTALRKWRARSDATGCAARAVLADDGTTYRGPDAQNRRAPFGAFVRRILVNEDKSVPLVGGAVRLAAEWAANLRMYVARPSVRA